MADAPQTLHSQLGYTFSDPTRLQQALTHRSRGSRNNERLEFLGDSVLGCAISAYLYEHFSTLSEGKLTRLRASLVKKETLAELARGLELGPHLLLGGGELRSGGCDRDSILADALEAIIGAVYIDGGIDEARGLVLRIYDDKLSKLDPSAIYKDPKTRLQEYLQKLSLETPTYTVLDISGEPHKQVFMVQCAAPGMPEPVTGEGNTRRAAEQAAAARALETLSVA